MLVASDVSMDSLSQLQPLCSIMVLFHPAWFHWHVWCAHCTCVGGEECDAYVLKVPDGLVVSWAVTAL